MPADSITLGLWQSPPSVVYVELSAGFVHYNLSQWSRHQALLNELAGAFQLRPAPLTAVNDPRFENAGLDVRMLRLDRIHPVISGNKWFKLRFNLADALLLKRQCLLTFGGAWSNHLHAFSYAGHLLGLRTVAFIRGEEWQHQSNPLLDDLRRWGTEVVALSRQDYRRRNEPGFRKLLLQRHGGDQGYMIPEGADNVLGMLGMASLMDQLTGAARHQLQHTDDVWLACGTGNSFTGLRLGLPAGIGVCGVSVLKGEWFAQAVRQKLAACWPVHLLNWQVCTQFHGGGFGKLPPRMRQFMMDFEKANGIPLDPVYTAKLCYAVVHLASEGVIPRGKRLTMVHTGGLQGRRSLEQQD